MSKTLLLITILLALFQLTLADFKISTPWIVSDIACRKFNPGDRIRLKVVCPEQETTIAPVTLLQRGTQNSSILVESVKLTPGKTNTIWVTLPSKEDFVKTGFVYPSPQNYIAIYMSGKRVDYTATFRIGDPNFGVTFTKPRAGDIIQRGSYLHAEWFGDFEKGFVFAWALFEPTNNFSLPSKYFYPSDVNFTEGELYYQIPKDLPSGNLWKFGCRANGTTQGAMEIFSAGTFLIE